MNKTPIVVNLFAGPGAGKSTIAAEVYARLKRASACLEHPFEVELVREFAKDEVWAGHKDSFSNQLYISAMQERRQQMLRDKVDVIVTDSPVILGCLFGADEALWTVLVNSFESYRNMNFFIKRTKPYNPNGRNEDEVGAKALDASTIKLLDILEVPFDIFEDSPLAHKEIASRVLNCLIE